jgi:hypothetical protein
LLSFSSLSMMLVCNLPVVTLNIPAICALRTISFGM